MELRNRIVMPPMVTQYASEDGSVTERQRGYYEARARGGVGLVIVEASYVEPRGQSFRRQVAVSDDRCVPGLKGLVEVAHRHGAKIAIQLHHGGRTAKSELTGMKPVAPSPVAAPPEGEVPEELTVEQIAALVRTFAAAGGRAMSAGFDGVELHGAHGYLIDQFLSSASNRRRDAYGGDVRGRSRFLVEIIRAVREKVGRDYPVWCRINGREYGVENGTSLEDAQRTAQLAEEAGVDAIHVSAYGPETPTNLTTRTFMPAVIADLAEGVKKAVSLPVIAVGRITPEAAESLLREGKADLVAMGKALLADPELPNKVRAGKLEDIRPCIVCMGCRDDVYYPHVLGIRCSVNPCLGQERESAIRQAGRPKRVLVVGGGAAGMEAATVAAWMGHKVTLWERGTRLGGQLLQAAAAPYKDRVGALVGYLETQARKSGVKVELFEEASAAAVQELQPDALVIGTGVKPWLPPIPGLDKARAVLAGAVLEGKASVGNRVAIIGAELVGCEVAEFLAERGKQVVLMRRSAEAATRIGPSLRPFLLRRLAQKGITLLPGISYREVTPEGITVTTAEGQTKTVEADAVVVAAGSVPDRTLYDELKDKCLNIHLVGDCVEPRGIRDAVMDGYRVALQL
jgi:2,4-dienoyl-CoA reductase-like NADH-dependent reductase (Old Yellow Enzyme family)/thioredoxin reductase